MKKSSFSSRYQGFTLIEFMIASTLGLIVLAAVGSLFIYTRQLGNVAQARLDVQQSLRNAGIMIVRDARNAGNFGCLSMGQLYGVGEGRAFSNDFRVGYGVTLPSAQRDAAGASADYPVLNINNPAINVGTVINGSFGVRWVDPNNLPGVQNFAFSRNSGVLLFQYGTGSSAFTALTATGAGSPQTISNISFVDNEPVQTLTSTAQDGGFFALSSCRALSVFKVRSDSNLAIADFDGQAIQLTANSEPGVFTNQQKSSQITLSRYMVTAYAVGRVGGENNDSLYRFELASDGTWSPPERLVGNVRAMQGTFFYIADCPAIEDAVGAGGAINETALNGHHFTEVAAATTGTVEDGSQGILRVARGGVPFYYPPVAVRLNITYGYEQAGGVNTNQNMNNNQFLITAAVRGGNICAERQLQLQ